MFCKFILVREHARLQSYFIHSFIPIQMGCDIKHLWQKMEILQQHIGRKITIFFWLHCVVCPREENTFGEKKCYYMMRLNNTLVNILCTLGRIRVFLCFALAENQKHFRPTFGREGSNVQSDLFTQILSHVRKIQHCCESSQEHFQLGMRQGHTSSSTQIHQAFLMCTNNNYTAGWSHTVYTEKLKNFPNGQFM